jgi:murein DD-endopeptidase MepM/ murein hydrolase activator NlpD
MQDEKLAQSMAGVGGIGLHRILVDQLGANMPKSIETGPGDLIHPLGPGKHRVSSEFGPRRHPIHGDHRMHAGLDVAAAQGAPVMAARGGVVTHAGRMGGYGLMIEMEHADGMTTRYAHLDRLDVELGDELRTGVRIGSVGATGAATGPHLHFEVRVDGEPSDPSKLLAKRVQR